VHHNIAAYEAAVRRHVTVIIPWHGQEEDLLREALRSLPRGVNVIIAKNAGKHEMASAVNAALEATKTRYVFFMGSDDVLDSETLWRLWEAAIDYDGAYPWMLGFGDRRFRFPAEPWSLRRIQDANVGGALLVKTAAARAVGGYADKAIEDWDFSYRLAKDGYRLAPAPRARYGYRQRPGGLCRSTIDEAASMGLSVMDLAPYDERENVSSIFYQWKYDGTAYVRCDLASRTAGGVVRGTWDWQNHHQAPAWVYQYPNRDAQPYWDLGAKLGKKRVIDVDDNYLSADLASVVSKYHVENGKAWGERQESHKRMVEEADYVICATPALVEVYEAVNQNVVLCENSCDPIDWPRVQKKKRIVGCVLSANHYDHLHLVEDALRYADAAGAEVQIVGLDPDWDFSYTHFAFTPSVASYRRVLSRWSIGLAPVIDNDVTRCKSDLKWLEFTMSGAALVASSAEAYERVPDDSIIRVDGAEGFAGAVGDLLHDERERKRLIRRSMFHVKQDRLVGNESLRNRYTKALA
jgi:glycosyltransferase involved in cell wall biosynthesis